MKSKRVAGLLVSVLCTVFVCPALVQAVIVPLDDSGWAMVVSPSSEEVSVPIVDGITNDAVYIQLGKTFSSPPEDGFFRPIIIEFEKIFADATANIIIRDEYIVNNTGTEWIDFHMSLKVSVVNPQAGFNPNFIPDGGQLENVYYSWNYGYEGLPIKLNFVDTDGSGVPSSPPGDDVFWPGYMGGQIVIATNPDMQVGGRFGLKEIPTVPEPATAVLLGIGGALLTLTRRRRSA